ncbi:MAG: DUF1328 domain-containing protein [Candidatus Izemoplasmataceae bacterium]|jgi:uncharacterized membrane protein YtjA (UPF0391 family)|uniref:DUF1328 domain-containing protein n=1 Tax=Liberiplasma polymorphum TaxID=3374570 RepID=UPI003772634A
MLEWAIIFFLVAIVAGFFGFGRLSFAAAKIAKVLFFIFIILFLITLIFGRNFNPPF